MVSDEIRQEAFEYVKAGNKAALLKLTALHHELVDIRSQANDDTLLIRAFKYLREDIIQALLIRGADISAKDEHGMPATMWIYATERTDLTTEEYDNTALRISKKYLSLENAESYSDEYTNLLLNSTKAKFPVHCNNDGYDHTTILTKIIQRNLVQSAEWFIKNFQLNQNETAESLIAGTIRMSSGNLTSTEVRNVEFLLEKHLNLIDENSKCANNLAEMLFQEKFYKEYYHLDMTCPEFHRLQSGQSIGHYGSRVYHDIHVLVAKILIKFGIDLQKYESYVKNLASVHDSLIPLLCRQINPEDYKSYFEGLPNNVKELLKSELPAEENSEPYDVLEVLDSDDESDYNITIDLYDVFINHRIYSKIQDAFILESTKKKILQLTKVSSILSAIKHAKDYADFHISYENLPITIDVVLNRIDYLRKKDNVQEFDKQEIEALSNFISNKIILSVTTDEKAIDVCNSFIEYFMNKCNSITRFKEFLNENMLEDKANKALKSILYQTTEDSFKTNISSLATKIAELTDGVVLPLDINFLSLNNTNSKIVNIDYEKQNLIKNNLKLFSYTNTYRIPNDDKL
ncbi:putative ankyrin repeat protein, partial [Orientia tsutsugamushi str. UT76]